MPQEFNLQEIAVLREVHQNDGVVAVGEDVIRAEDCPIFD